MQVLHCSAQTLFCTWSVGASCCVSAAWVTAGMLLLMCVGSSYCLCVCAVVHCAG
jgi:hypothetical protein